MSPEQEDKRDPKNSRRILEVLESVEKRMPKNGQRPHLHSFVSYRAALAGIVAALPLLGMFSVWLLDVARERADVSAVKAAAPLQVEVGQAKLEASAAKAQGIETQKDVRAIYRFLTTKQPQGRLERSPNPVKSEPAAIKAAGVEPPQMVDGGGQ